MAKFRKRRLKAVLCQMPFNNDEITLAAYTLRAYAYKDRLIRKDADIKIMDCSLWKDNEDLARDIIDQSPDIVGFSCFLWNVRKVPEIIRLIKQRESKAVIICGGPEASFMPDRLLLSHMADIVVLGEGELAFSGILKLMIRRKGIQDRLTSIPGIAFKSGKRIVFTGKPKVVEDLDSIPPVFGNPEMKRSRVRYIETSRGCPYRCKYCGWSYGKSVRRYSSKRVINDLKNILKDNSYELLYFTDSNILLRKDIHIIADTLNRYAKREILVNLFINIFGLKKYASPPVVIKPHINLLFGIGIQDVSLRALKECDRAAFSGSDIVRDNVRLLRTLFKNCNIVPELIFGLPGGSFKSFLETLNLCLSLNPYYMDISRLLVLPGSEYFLRSKDYGLRFQKEAPYKIIENPTFPESKIRKAGELSCHIAALTPIFKDVYSLGRKTGNYISVLNNAIKYLKREAKFKVVSNREYPASYSLYFHFSELGYTSNRYIKALKGHFREYEKSLELTNG